MPVTVIVRSASGDAPSLTLDGARIVIGRSAGSDVRLPDPSVSQRHATIRANGGEYAIVDEGSTNGTWVGGIKLDRGTPRVLRSGDLVRVGRVWLELVTTPKPVTPDLGLATRDLALVLVRNAMDALGDDTIAKVRVAEGADLGAELALRIADHAYTIGRAEKCDLPLADEDVSREHAAVMRRGGQVMIKDLASHNGVLLGDAPISKEREIVWKPSAMVKLGTTVLALDEPVTAALADLEAAPDEALPDDAAPPTPAPSAAGSTASKRAHAPVSSEPAPPSRLSQAGAAPIAEIAPTPGRAARRAWTITDVVVVLVAVSVIGASIAGLVWVLR
jgi:pSer/pThr/pTyr-binding forkhead associated (FHA) protein